MGYKIIDSQVAPLCTLHLVEPSLCVSAPHSYLATTCSCLQYPPLYLHFTYILLNPHQWLPVFHMYSTSNAHSKRFEVRTLIWKATGGLCLWGMNQYTFTVPSIYLQIYRLITFHFVYILLPCLIIHSSVDEHQGQFLFLSIVIEW